MMADIDIVTTEKILFSLIGVLSGCCIHHGLFIHGEWHNQAPTILGYYASVFGCVAVFRLICYKSDLTSELSSGFVFASLLHVLSLTASILVYRGFFHRLNNAKFPGPWWARYTKIGQIWENRDSKNHLYLHRLHETYGDVVRTGEFRPTVRKTFEQ